MSTAKNHAQRSHRSNYRSRAWSGSRRSVITPTVNKTGLMGLIKKIRKVRPAMKEQKPND